MYRKSFDHHEQMQDQQSERLDALTREAEEFPGVSLVLVLSPHEPLTGKFNKQHLQQLLQNVELGRFSIDQGFSFLDDLRMTLSARDRGYTGKQEVNRLHVFIEVDFDGTVAIAIQFAVDEPDMGHQGRLLYVNQLDETAQNEVDYALIEAFNCASQIANFLNPSSGAELYLRLIPHQNDPIIIRKNEGPTLGSFICSRKETTPIKNFRAITHTLQTIPSSTEAHEMLTNLILEVLNQCGIETMNVLQPLKESDETLLS